MTEPMLKVFYTDDAIMLRTRNGAEVVMPPADAAALAIGLIGALQGFGEHQALIAQINEAMKTDDDGDEGVN